MHPLAMQELINVHVVCGWSQHIYSDIHTDLINVYTPCAEQNPILNKIHGTTKK